MRPAVICFAILLFCVGTVQEDAVVEEMEFDEQLENMHEGLENFDETEGAHTDAGVLARAEGQFVAEEADDLAEKTGQPAFRPFSMEQTTAEVSMLRGVGDSDYADECAPGPDGEDEVCGKVENFGSLLPPAYRLPEEVRRFVGAIILGWGAHRNPPLELWPYPFDWHRANRTWHAQPSKPCTLPEDSHHLVEFEALFTDQDADLGALERASMELLRAGGRMRSAGQMPHNDSAELHVCPFCAKCLPVYAAAAYAHAWALDLASGPGNCVQEELGHVREGALLLNFAWSVLNFEDRLEDTAYGVTLATVRLEHDRWMRALGACISPARTQQLAEMVPIKYPLQASIAGAYPEQAKLLEHLEPSGHEFSLPVNFVTLASLLSLDQLSLHRRRVLIDAGAGGPFHTGTKALIDMYEARASFDEVILIEMDTDRLAVSDAYQQRYNISVWTAPLRVGRRDKRSDLLLMLEEVLALSEQDFVVLKFDCDVGSGGASMEWGFMADLVLSDKYLRLVDEIFVEMHYYHPAIWRDSFAAHTMWQHFDLLRQLREYGVIVHQWP